MGKINKKNDLEKYLKSALKHIVAAGHGIKEFNEFAIEHLGEIVRPHIRDFVKDVHEGAIRVKGITKATRTKIFGHFIEEEKREQMIREAAYFLSEKRNFIGGDAETDWYQAEKMVTRKLDEESGLAAKGLIKVEHASSVIKEKLETLEKDVQKWVEKRQDKSV